MPLLLILCLTGCESKQSGKQSLNLSKCFDMTEDELKNKFGEPTAITGMSASILNPVHSVTDLMYKKRDHQGAWPFADEMDIVHFDYRLNGKCFRIYANTETFETAEALLKAYGFKDFDKVEQNEAGTVFKFKSDRFDELRVTKLSRKGGFAKLLVITSRKK
ncbi:hypothetical protein ACFL1X_06015 [Candidatus Hydrogenedentota bacterium]